MSKTTQFIPQRKDFPSHEQWDAHVQAYQMIHDLQEQIRQLKSQLSTSDIGRSAAAKDKTGVITSHVNGFFVKAGTPANGQTIRFNSTSQQFEFGA
jgi:hypothetical protein